MVKWISIRLSIIWGMVIVVPQCHQLLLTCPPSAKWLALYNNIDKNTLDTKQHYWRNNRIKRKAGIILKTNQNFLNKLISIGRYWMQFRRANWLDCSRKIVGNWGVLSSFTKIRFRKWMHIAETQWGRWTKVLVFGKE